MRITRRRFLGAGAAAATAFLAPRLIRRFFGAQSEGIAVNPPTWVLFDAKTPSQVPQAVLRNILTKPGVAGLSLAQMWDVVEPVKGVYDFSTAELVASICADLGKGFSYRVRGGQHTPSFRTGPTWTSEGITAPRPFTTTGKPNSVFVTGLKALYTALAQWATTHPTDILHCSWYGGLSAELWAKAAVKALVGYSDAALQAAHLAIVDMAQALPADLTVEFPIGGYAPNWLKKAIVADLAENLRPSYVQQNNLSGGHQAGIVTWPFGALPPHGLQMVHDGTTPTDPPGGYDWAQVYADAVASKAAYVEVYLKSFQTNNFTQLYVQVAA